ncbi:GNAT family N-acetyltransferase [Litoreibacter roseus]|uniref:GNAT family N-acetyltransferase n=1 Tax=Litoreibacter roseus TaxID=2601869 RepID=A0A6N6JK08_9RHOB|nr:GNAT family N-acetyltransferase [Litoreibacter roseus]GFE65769.1 GNAT family N-acetyltransferase [Litoreibacter roseus]
MKNNDNIRPVEQRDIPGLRAILDETELFPSGLLEDMLQGFLGGTVADLWFTYVEDDQPLAFGFCEPERMTDGTWNLLAIAVLPNRHGQGIGAQMMGYLENQLSQKGARVLIVETMGTPEFKLTRQFYKKTGYVEEACIREFYEAGADKIVFWKHL